MSRIGKQEIIIPKDIRVEHTDSRIVVSKGNQRIEHEVPLGITVTMSDGKIAFTRNSDVPRVRALHGLIQKLVHNAVVGLQTPFKKVLSIHGIGYKAQVTGKQVAITVGYSHQVMFPIPEDIQITVDQKVNNIIVTGFDKMKVGEVAAEIRDVKPPEPYKATGIRYADEKVRRKAGKAGAGAGAGAAGAGAKAGKK